MMANNWQRLNIWLKTVNRFDYAEFSDACKAASVEPQSSMEFAQKAGMISCAVVANPELSAADAYLKFIQPPVSQNQSKGLGDTIAKITHATGLDKIAEAYTAFTGQPCGCASRQEALNKLIPYSQK